MESWKFKIDHRSPNMAIWRVKPSGKQGFARDLALRSEQTLTTRHARNPPLHHPSHEGGLTTFLALPHAPCIAPAVSTPPPVVLQPRVARFQCGLSPLCLPRSAQRSDLGSHGCAKRGGVRHVRHQPNVPNPEPREGGADQHRLGERRASGGEGSPEGQRHYERGLRRP